MTICSLLRGHNINMEHKVVIVVAPSMTAVLAAFSSSRRRHSKWTRGGHLQGHKFNDYIVSVVIHGAFHATYYTIGMCVMLNALCFIHPTHTWCDLTYCPATTSCPPGVFYTGSNGEPSFTYHSYVHKHSSFKRETTEYEFLLLPLSPIPFILVALNKPPPEAETTFFYRVVCVPPFHCSKGEDCVVLCVFFVTPICAF